MDFEGYVAARHATLVRVAALLGCPEHDAPRLVDEALTGSARDIERADYPDPDVYRALLDRVRGRQDRWPVDALPPEDRTNAEGTAVRRQLAALDPAERQAVVLLEHGDLTLAETAYAMDAVPEEVLMAARAAEDVLGTHTRARLQSAADTVDVPQLAPLPRPPRPRRWPWVVAAGSALVAVTALIGVATGGPPGPDGRLDEDQIPSVFGLDTTEATLRLERLGLEVDDEPVYFCDPTDRALATVPPTGTRFARGDEVALQVPFPVDASCQVRFLHRYAAWRFVDFATGRGPAPPFHDKLWLVVDRSEPAVLFGPDVGDPQRWGDSSALTALRQASAQVVHEDGRWHTPALFVEYGVPPAGRCGVPRPPASGGREALSLSIYVATDSTSDPCPVTVDLYRTRSGAIDAVVLYSGRRPGAGR